MVADALEVGLVVQHHPAAAVHLQVDEARRQHPAVEPHPRRPPAPRPAARSPPTRPSSTTSAALGVQPRPVEDRGARRRPRWSYRLRHLAQVGRRVGVEPAPPRQRLDEAVEATPPAPAARSADAPPRPRPAGSPRRRRPPRSGRRPPPAPPAARRWRSPAAAPRRRRRAPAPGNAPAPAPPARAAPRRRCSSRRGCALVSLNFSAISLAMAKPGPRPSTKAEFARTSRSASGAQSQASARANCPGSAATAARSPSSSRHSATSASAASTEATKVLVAATLRSGPGLQRQRVVAGRRHRRVGDVGDRHGQRAAGAGAPHHLDDVRALPRLRDADAGRAVEPQLPAVDRGDRRPDRGHRHARRRARRHT